MNEWMNECAMYFPLYKRTRYGLLSDFESIGLFCLPAQGSVFILVFPVFCPTGGTLSFHGGAETEDHSCLFRCFQWFIKELVVEKSKQRHAGRRFIIKLVFTMKLFITVHWVQLVIDACQGSVCVVVYSWFCMSLFLNGSTICTYLNTNTIHTLKLTRNVFFKAYICFSINSTELFMKNSVETSTTWTNKWLIIFINKHQSRFYQH